MVVADLPFGSYQASPQAALGAATRFLKESGAHAVKLEGGDRVLRQVEELVADDERPDELLAEVLDERTASDWLVSREPRSEG